MVVYGDLEFSNGAGVDEAEAVSIVLLDGELGLSRVVVTGIAAIISVRRTIKATLVSMVRTQVTFGRLLRIGPLNEPIVRNGLSIFVARSKITW